MIIVIGSGPSSVACVTALINRGVKVTVLDAGIELEENIAKNIIAHTENGHSHSFEPLKGDMKANAKGIPLKLSFGSDFPYREASERLRISENTSGALPSFAFGGLSNVWGAAMLPYRNADIVDWPISAEDLAPHYRKIAEIINVTASSTGSMDEIFPSFLATPGKLDFNLQGRSLWQDLKKASIALKKEGILFGRGRLAVQTTSEMKGGCDYKGFCMYGCPNGYIYNSRDTIRKLHKEGKIDYIADIVVKKISESDHGLEIDCIHRLTGEQLLVKGSKVFLAAGAIPSTRILMESLHIKGRKIIMRDSQYFLFPLLRLRGSPGVSTQPSNTLSQIFIEMLEGSGIMRSAHLQVYGFNDMISMALKSTLGFAGKYMPFLINYLEERLLIVQGYLHSDLSGSMETWLEDGALGDESRMHIQAIINPSSKKHIARIIHRLLWQSHRLKAIPILPMLQIATPGRGYHIGSTFPMRRVPKEGESDILGRPYGFKNLHVVDSTVLPSIPATTITFSVMANSHRIATNCEL